MGTPPQDPPRRLKSASLRDRSQLGLAWLPPDTTKARHARPPGQHIEAGVGPCPLPHIPAQGARTRAWKSKASALGGAGQRNAVCMRDAHPLSKPRSPRSRPTCAPGLPCDDGQAVPLSGPLFLELSHGNFIKMPQSHLYNIHRPLSLPSPGPRPAPHLGPGAGTERTAVPGWPCCGPREGRSSLHFPGEEAEAKGPVAAHTGPSPSTFPGDAPQKEHGPGPRVLSLLLGQWLPGVSPGPSHTPQASCPVSPPATSTPRVPAREPQSLSRSLPPRTVSFLPSFLDLRLRVMEGVTVLLSP